MDPYPGLASFSDSREGRLLFFGRDKERQTLLEMVLAENLILLFARSGIGKTSLLNAGVLEQLRDRGFFPVVVRLTHDADRGPIQSVYECVVEQAKRDAVTVSGEASTGSLWEYFYNTQFVKNGKLLRPVLVLDQFEELFTIIGPQKSRRESFVKELADIVRRRVPDEVRKRETRNLEKLQTRDAQDPERQRIVSLLYEGDCPELRIIISIREDFLAEIEGLKSELPTIFRNSFRLEPLSIDEARNAIELPTQQTDLLGDNRFTFAPGVVDRMLDFLRVQKAGGKFIRGDTVEPVQLQILCKHFYHQSVEKKLRQETRQKSSTTSPAKTIPEITLNDLKGRNGMKRAMVGYYRKVLRQFPRFRPGWSTRKYRPSPRNLLVFYRARAAIRFLAENKLVTPGGYRNSLSVDVIQRGIGVPESDLSRLVEERLLRTEPRLGSHFYELTHDTLVRPLVKARRKRRAYWAISLTGLLIAFLSLPAVASYAYWQWSVLRLQSHASSSGKNKEERIAALRELLNGSYQDCSACDLSWLDLHSFRVASANFSAANLSHADLHEAQFVSSNFSRADLSLAQLNDTTLAYSNFAGANLTQANLSKADLQGTNVTHAMLKGASFAGAKLDDADFSDAVIEQTNFADTRWWLATGWTRNTITVLQNKWPHQNVAASEEYKKEIERIPRDSKDEYSALNSLAWLRATSGIELDKAEADARNSLAADPGSERRMDTLGYVLIQLGKYDEAEAYLNRSLQIRQLRESDPFRIGLAHYHLALALDRKGKYSEAQKHFDQAKTNGYVPSHECLLVPPSDPKNCTWPNPRNASRTGERY